MKVTINRAKDALLEIECADLESWKDRDRLVRCLKQEFSARVSYKVEGPDARRWFIVVNGKKLTVDHSDRGFLSVVAADNDAEAIMADIAESLQNVSPALTD
jgi:hypothetical protein